MAKSKLSTASKYNNDETATMSALNEVLDGAGGPHFGIHNDTLQHISRPFRPERNAEPPRKDYSFCNDATASLSDIGALLGENCSIKEDYRKQSSAGAFTIFSDDADPSSRTSFAIHDENAIASTLTKPIGSGFEIFSDDTATQKKRRMDEPSFGDISRIDNDEKTSNFQILDENSASHHNPIDAIDYLTKHKSDMESAMRECMKDAAKSRSDLQIFDFRRKSIPRELLRKSFSNGFTIDLFDGRKAKIIHELGRGVHGVVLLCSSATDTSEGSLNDALKIQAPIGSLAHEYLLLLRLEERVDLDSSGFYPFPQPQALYAFSEGGLFVMTAGSDSGMTLMDVVNTCNKSIGSVPEMLAIYYTSRMLRHLECLHCEGKILVRFLLSLMSYCTRDLYLTGCISVAL
jgi:hypothetical protein